MARVISFNIAKGGSQKTVSVINVAYDLAKNHDKKVLIIDTDPQGNVCTSLGIDHLKKEMMLEQIISGEATIDETLISYEGVDIIPSSPRLHLIEYQTTLKEAKGETSDGKTVLAKIVEDLKPKYDFIIMDTPPSAGTLQLWILNATEEVWLPAKLDELGVKGIEQMLTYLVRSKFVDKVKGILPAMVNKRTIAARETWSKLNELTKDTQIKLVKLEEGIPNSTIVPKGLGGLPTVITKPFSPVGEAFANFVEKYIL